MSFNPVASSLRVGALAARRMSASVQSHALRLWHARSLSATFRVKSHLTVQERVALYRLAEGKTAICEIGSYLGASACCFGAALRRQGAGTILCIDTWQNDAMTEGTRDTYSEFSRNTAPYSQFIEPLRGLSTDVVGEVEQRTKVLDLLFIDGDHSYEGASADWRAYRHLLAPGSIVAFHDVGWAEGVVRVVKEDVKPFVRWFDALPNLWWGEFGSA
jgi:predicted O-methyltransferase YrrM